MKRKGFTIVELLVVIAIIGVLLGIVSVAVSGSLKNGRSRRATAMCNVLQQAIAMYYTKEGKWPGRIDSVAENMPDDKDTYTLLPNEADEVFREIVKRSTGSSASMMLVDASALFVADSGKLRNNGEGCYDNHSDSSLPTFCGNQHCVNGTDFSRACKRGEKGYIPLDNMVFGYAATGSGKFSRYWITYNCKTDSVKVTRQNPKYEDKYPPEWE